MLNETKSIYEPKVTMEEIYNSYFSNDALIPIYTVNQLLAIGNGEKINIDGKIYTFTSNKVYILKNNLEFSVKDLGLETDWIPTYNSENIEWNGHTIKVTTLNENVITYSENTIIGYPITLADTKESVLADYRIYGNSIQNGTPTPTSAVEIQSVGERVNIIDKSKALIEGVKNETEVSVWAKEAFDNNWVINNLKPNTTYTISYDVECIDVPEYDSESQSNLGFYLYSNKGYSGGGTLQKEYLKEGQKVSFSRTFTTPAEVINTEANYRILLYTNYYKKDGKSVFGTMIFSNVQIEENSRATEYVPYGKYRIPVKVSGENGNEQIFNIILDEPLRKVGKYVDYIDFANQQIVRNVEVLDNTGTLTIEESYQGLETPKIESIELPKVQLYKGINKITIGTDVQPSNMSITYNVKQ